jgi:hypothetical protein
MWERGAKSPFILPRVLSTSPMCKPQVTSNIGVPFDLTAIYHCIVSVLAQRENFPFVPEQAVYF